MPDTGTLVTLRGTPAFTAGKFANGLSSGALQVTSSMAASTTVTIEAWMKTTANSTRVAVGNNTTGIWLGLSGTKFGINTDGGALQSAAARNDGNWHHVAATWDGAELKLWVDGVLEGTVGAAAIGSQTATGVLAIGGFGATGGFDFADVGGGMVDEVRFSNVMRYTSTFTPPAAAFTTDANTLGLFHLDGGSGGGAFAIDPDDENLHFSPGNWDVTSVRAATLNAGAYGRVLVGGIPSEIVLNFDVDELQAPLPLVKYRIDDGPWVSEPIAATIDVPVPTSNAWDRHYVEWVVQSTSEFVDRWGSAQALVKFTGLTGTAGTTGEALPLRRPAKRVIVLGDSITEGYKTLTNETSPAGSDATVGWAYLLRDLLGIDVGVVGFGGAGLTHGGQGGVPNLADSRTKLLGPGGPARSFVGVDVLVINYGENDVDNVTSEMTGVLNSFIGSLLPSATKIVVMRPFSGAQAANLAAAVAACSDPSRVTYVDTTGWWSSADSSDGQHPYGYASQAQLGPRLAAAVRPLIDGGGIGRLFVNVGGTAQPLSI